MSNKQIKIKQIFKDDLCNAWICWSNIYPVFSWPYLFLTSDLLLKFTLVRKNVLHVMLVLMNLSPLAHSKFLCPTRKSKWKNFKDHLCNAWICWLRICPIFLWPYFCLTSDLLLKFTPVRKNVLHVLLVLTNFFLLARSTFQCPTSESNRNKFLTMIYVMPGFVSWGFALSFYDLISFLPLICY